MVPKGEKLSTEFQTLKECIEAKKGAFIGVIIKQSDLNSGTKNDKDWTNKRFTILGEDGFEIELTAWGDDIEKFKIGNKYEFTGFWYKEYQGNTQLSVGKFGKVNLIGTATTVETGLTAVGTGQTTIPTEPVDGDINLPTNSIETEATSLPEIGPNLEVFSEEQCIQLLQIEKVVKETMTKFAPTEIQSGQKVGMYTKEIYRESKKFKFEKASES